MEKKHRFVDGPVFNENLDRWVCDFRFPDGARKIKRFRQERKARTWWAKQQASIDDGTWNGAPVPKAMTLGQAIDAYREYARVHQSSFETYTNCGLKVWERELGRDTLLAKIKPGDIERVKEKRLAQVDLSDVSDEEEAETLLERRKSTINKDVAVLKRLFSWLKEQETYFQNPAAETKLFKINNERVRYLEPEEFERLLEECRKSYWYLLPIVLVAANTGLRKRTILFLRWDQIDLKARTVRIKRTKTRKTVALPLANPVHACLKQLYDTREERGQSDYVFHHKEGKTEAGLPIKDVKFAFNAAVTAAGISDFHFHDLRHCFASWLVMRGEDLNKVRELLGHTTIKMTLRYAHLSPTHLRNAVSKLDDMFSKCFPMAAANQGNDQQQPASFGNVIEDVTSAVAAD